MPRIREARVCLAEAHHDRCHFQHASCRRHQRSLRRRRLQGPFDAARQSMQRMIHKHVHTHMHSHTHTYTHTLILIPANAHTYTQNEEQAPTAQEQIQQELAYDAGPRSCDAFLAIPLKLLSSATALTLVCVCVCLCVPYAWPSPCS